MEMLAVWLAIAVDFALVIALGWHLFDVAAGQKKTDGDLTVHRETVARDYALRADVKEDLAEIKRTLDQIFALLRGLSGNR